MILAGTCKDLGKVEAWIRFLPDICCRGREHPQGFMTFHVGKPVWMLLKVNSTFETQQEFKPGLAGGLGCRKNLGVALGSCASASEPDLEV